MAVFDLCLAIFVGASGFLIVILGRMLLETVRDAEKKKDDSGPTGGNAA